MLNYKFSFFPPFAAKGKCILQAERVGVLTQKVDNVEGSMQLI